MNCEGGSLVLPCARPRSWEGARPRGRSCCCFGGSLTVGTAAPLALPLQKGSLLVSYTTLALSCRPQVQHRARRLCTYRGACVWVGPLASGRGRVRHACGSCLARAGVDLAAASVPLASAGGGVPASAKALRIERCAAVTPARPRWRSASAYTDAVDCVAAGFAPSLRCGSCATLEALVPDEDIVKDCRSCCADDDKVTYVKARLEVCE